MAENSAGDGLRDRLTKQGEDALGRLAQDLLENPLVNGAIARAFEAREKAAQAQEVAFGALNIPSASDIERLTRRVRSLSQRLEGIEDGVDRLDERLATIQETGALDERLSAIDSHLDAITKDLAALRKDAPKASTAKRQPTGGRASAAKAASARKSPAGAGKRAPRST
jgi:chromosome segregation ATPase